MRKPWQAIVVGTASGNESPPAGGKRTPAGKPAGRAGRQPGKKQRILAWLAGRGWGRVSEARAVELGAAFPDCSEQMRRAALLESGLALDPLVEGVRQESYERLESTLKTLLHEYQSAKEAGNAPRRQAIRAVVIRAKEHAELAAHNSRTGAEKRAEKIEMATWLRTWLENPPVFPDWATLRKRRLGRAGSGAEAEEPPGGD
ncbi:MAG: hypothetical protein ACLQBJ_19625 [Bryobacteraceae bacterium]